MDWDGLDGIELERASDLKTALGRGYWRAAKGRGGNLVQI